MISTRLKQEDGIALVVAMLLMAIMLSLGLVAIGLADGQARTTAQQRQRESAFNVAEAALNAQVTQLSQHWADIKGGTGTGACPGATYCPSSAELTSLIPSADANVPITWKTNVYDDIDPLDGYFADSLVANQPAWDSNGDNKVWVRAEATVRGHTRVIVSLVQKQMQLESVPHAAIVAGALTIENNGLHSEPIIDGNGGVIAVRCDINGPVQPCMGQSLGTPPTKTQTQWNDLLTDQISGFATAQAGYQAPSLFTQDQIYRFIATAKAGGTYYTGCPSTLEGAVVVVDTTGNCSYNGSTTWNTQADPGFVIFLRAGSSLTLGGTTTYNGIIYHANMGAPPILNSAPQSSDSLIITSGNTLINGGVIIDGVGRMDAGESGMNIHFDDHGYDAVQSLAAAGIVQNSWREIKAGA